MVTVLSLSRDRHEKTWRLTFTHLTIKTHDSESRGQQEAAVRDE